MSLYSDLNEVLTPYANRIKGLAAILGSLSNLETTDKSSIVAAINEAAQSGGTEIVIDDTLTQSGQAADAKATGDAISQLSADLLAVEGVTLEDIDIGSAYATAGLISGLEGSFTANDLFTASGYIDISKFADCDIFVTCSLYNNAGFAFYDANSTYISGETGTLHGENGFFTTKVTVPGNAQYIRFCVLSTHGAYSDCKVGGSLIVDRIPADIAWELYPVGWSNNADQTVGDTLAVDTRTTSYYHGTVDVSDIVGKDVVVSTYAPTSRPTYAVDEDLKILAIYATATSAASAPQSINITVPSGTKYLVINCQNYPTNTANITGAGVPVPKYAKQLKAEVTALAEEVAALEETDADSTFDSVAEKVISDSDPTYNIYCYEEMAANGNIYLSFVNILIGNPTTTAHSFSSIYSAVDSTYQGVSPDGVTCIKLTHSRMLAYDVSDSTFKVVQMNQHTSSQVILALCINGMLTQGLLFDATNHKRTLDFKNRLEKVSRANEKFDVFTRRVLSDQDESTMTFMFMTDTHIDTHIAYPNGYLTSLRTIETVGAVSNACNVVANIHGGDILTTGYDSKDIPAQTLRRFCTSWRSNSKVPAIILRGNHDDNSYGVLSNGDYVANTSTDAIINETEWFMAAQNPGRRDSKIVFDTVQPNSGVCYIDDEFSKIRILCMNTTELPETTNGNGNYLHTARILPNCGFLQNQLNFMADALTFSDKSDPSEWAVLIVSHIPIEMMRKTNDGFEGYTWFGIGDHLANRNLFFGILNAYRDGTSYSGTGCTNDENTSSAGTDFEASVNVDYTSKGAGEVIGFVCGHLHFDNTLNTVGKEGSEEYGYRYITIDSGNLSAAAITVNRESHTISVRKIAGTVLAPSDAVESYGFTQGLFDEDLNEYGDWETTYSTYVQ